MTPTVGAARVTTPKLVPLTFGVERTAVAPREIDDPAARSMLPAASIPAAAMVPVGELVASNVMVAGRKAVSAELIAVARI